jgi:purine-cytosine permease-like protein
MISSKTSPLIVVLIIFLANLILSSVSETYSFVFMLTTTLSAINVMTLNNYLVKNRNKKNFDIDFVTREHFSDSIKLISLILLFFTILISFTSGEIRNILIASGISSILSIVINHLVSRILFKDGK